MSWGAVQTALIWLLPQTHPFLSGENGTEPEACQGPATGINRAEANGSGTAAERGTLRLQRAKEQQYPCSLNRQLQHCLPVSCHPTGKEHQGEHDTVCQGTRGTHKPGPRQALNKAPNEGLNKYGSRCKNIYVYILSTGYM